MNNKRSTSANIGSRKTTKSPIHQIQLLKKLKIAINKFEKVKNSKQTFHAAEKRFEAK